VNFVGRFPLLLLLLSIAAFAAGCSSYVANREPSTDLGKYQRFFVKSNFHDNHGIDTRIVRALQARGFHAEKGPLTMLPKTAQAIVTYDDRWNWDFKNHMTYLVITLQDVRTEQPIASATFSGPAALTITPDEVIERLLNKVYREERKAQK
jgi:hypothetical protein